MAALQSKIPDLKETVEEKFNEMKRYFEESQSKAIMEQNTQLEECTKGKKDLIATITILMAEVKMINAKTNTHNEESPKNHSTSNRERSEVEQN